MIARSGLVIMDVVPLNMFFLGGEMKLEKRARYAILALLVLTALLLLNVNGPVWTDGAAYYAPIMVCGFLVWRFFVYGKRRSKSYTFLAGTAGGILGTLVWPTGILVALMVTGNADGVPVPVAMLFASLFVSSILGGVVAMLFSAGFDRTLDPTGTVPIQDESLADPITVPNAV